LIANAATWSRRIRLARFPQTKSFDTFDFAAQPSLSKALVLELIRCEWIDKRENCIALRTELAQAQAEIERLRLIIRKLQRNQFGRRAESLDDDQLRLGFDDLDADVARAEATWLREQQVCSPDSLPAWRAPPRFWPNFMHDNMRDLDSRSRRLTAHLPARADE
jgi:hypothetical protein